MGQRRVALTCRVQVVRTLPMMSQLWPRACCLRRPGLAALPLRVCSEGQGLALSCLQSDTEEGAALRVPISGRTEGGCVASPTLGDACFSDRSVLLCPAALPSVRPLHQSCARREGRRRGRCGRRSYLAQPTTDSGEAVKKFTTSDTIWECLQSIM